MAIIIFPEGFSIDYPHVSLTKLDIAVNIELLAEVFKLLKEGHIANYPENLAKFLIRSENNEKSYGSLSFFFEQQRKLRWFNPENKIRLSDADFKNMLDHFQKLPYPSSPEAKQKWDDVFQTIDSAVQSANVLFPSVLLNMMVTYDTPFIHPGKSNYSIFRRPSLEQKRIEDELPVRGRNQCIIL